MRYNPTLFFRSSQFPIEPGEDAATNPEMYGKALALWIGRRFVSPTFSEEKIVPEDYGWCVFVPADRFTLCITCVSTDVEKHEWGISVSASGGWLSRLLGRGSHQETVANTYAAVRQAVEALPETVILEEG